MARKIVPKIADGLLIGAMFIAVTHFFTIFSQVSYIPDYVYLIPAILGFISGYFAIFGGVFQNE